MGCDAAQASAAKPLESLMSVCGVNFLISTKGLSLFEFYQGVSRSLACAF
jgi:hypothetical protein